MQEKRSKPLLLALAGGLLLVAILVSVILLRSNRSAEQGPQKAAVVESSAAVPDAMPEALEASASTSPDARVEKPKPRPTHRVTDAELRRITRRYGGLLRACYHRAVRKGAHQVPRKVTIELNLAAGGKVQSATVNGIPGPGLRACVRRSLLGWRFPKNAKAQTLRFPIVMAR